MITITAGIHVHLPLHADVVLPAEVSGILRLVEFAHHAVNHQCHVCVTMVGVVDFHVPLDMVPSTRCEFLARDVRMKPVPARFAPRVPNTRRIVALGTDHVVVSANKLKDVVLKSLRARQRCGIKLNIKIPKKIRGVIIGAYLLPTRIDVLFKNVAAVHLPMLDGPPRRVRSDQYGKGGIACSGGCFTVEGRRVFVVRGSGFTGYVVAGVMAWHEDDREYHETSYFSLTPEDDQN